MASKILKTNQLRELDVTELNERLNEVKKELFNLRVQATTKELTDVNGISAKKREVARINTILAQKQQ
ncbi:MAG: 50S ribosomal protein L29 [Sumerlaeia bacterium]